MLRVNLEESGHSSEAGPSSSHLLRPPRRDTSASVPSNPAASHSSHEDGSASEARFSTPDRNPSLAINYVPTKFSSGRPSKSFRSRRHNGHSESMGSLMPKTGGGSGQVSRGGIRPVSEYDEGEEGDLSAHPWISGSQFKRHQKMRWNKFKWILFTANALLMLYTLIGLIFCLLTWFKTFQRADVLRVGNRPELIVSTLACCLGVFASLIGWAGILLNNRAFLAVYTFLLWIVFALILVPGYVTYKRRTFNLEGKISAQWSQTLGVMGRLRIQNELSCCGYFSPFVEATVSQTCYARSILPGCKLAYFTFERSVLKMWYTIAFLAVPVHISVMVAGLLCSNHVTYRFGKGMMPMRYRLSLASMAIIMEGLAKELAEQYGKTSAIASSRSKSKRREMALDSVPLLIGHG